MPQELKHLRIGIYHHGDSVIRQFKHKSGQQTTKNTSDNYRLLDVTVHLPVSHAMLWRVSDSSLALLLFMPVCTLKSGTLVIT